MRKPGISKVGFHALSERVHRGGVIFESLSRGGIQRERIGMLQKKGVDAYGVGHGIQGVSGMDFSVFAVADTCQAYTGTNIFNKRGAAFEVPGQSLGCCEGASHAPGF